jgi:dephospho-CoA kinase
LGGTPSAEKVKKSHFSLMASGSKPGPLLEERLGEMQMELIRLKAVVREKARSMLNNDFAGEQRYDLLVQDLKNLREDLTTDSDAQFKDVANVHVDFGKRLSKLKAKIYKLSEEWAKKKTTHVKGNEEGKSN